MDMVVGRYDDVAIVSVIVILVTVFLFLALFNTDSPSGDMDSCILHLPNHLTALWRSVMLHCVYGFMVEVAISFVVTVPQLPSFFAGRVSVSYSWSIGWKAGWLAKVNACPARRHCCCCVANKLIMVSPTLLFYSPAPPSPQPNGDSVWRSVAIHLTYFVAAVVFITCHVRILL